MTGNYFRSASFLTFILMFSLWSAGQAANSAALHGVVTDAKGAALVGAEIKATQTLNGQSRNTVTASDGSYSLPNLPVGPYELEISAVNFEKYLQKGIVLQVGENPLVNVTLKIGSASEVVEVSANATSVETRET